MDRSAVISLQLYAHPALNPPLPRIGLVQLQGQKPVFTVLNGDLKAEKSHLYFAWQFQETHHIVDFSC